MQVLDLILIDGIDSTGVAAVAVSMVGLFTGFATLALTRMLLVPAVVRSCTALLLLILAGLELMVLDALPTSDSSPLYRLAIITAGFFSLSIFLPRGALTSGTLTSVGRWRLSLELIALSLALYASFLYRPDVDNTPTLSNELVTYRDLVVEPLVAAYTDKNKRIPVYVNVAPDEPHAVSELDYLKKIKMDRLAIAVGKSDASFNCHGWIFTCGQFHVKCEDVDQILRDNGYETVAAPSRNDLIVYRDVAGNAMHAGVVHAVNADGGGIIIESKWGLLGRYLHRPADQCFSQNFTYYRSDRAGHGLAGFANEPTFEE